GLIEGAIERVVEVPEGLLHSLGFVIALTIVAFLHMVIGEMVPKNIAIAGPERSALVLGPVLYGVVLALKPIIVFLNWVANVVLRALRVEPKDEVASAFTADEVAAFIAESREEGLLEKGESELLASALTLSDRPVRTMTVPLADVVTLPVGVTYAEAEAECVRTGFSRFPLADADAD
ncbi:MAG: CNNM domain-containing protein, partial [Actinomycetes bacterium]